MKSLDRENQLFYALKLIFQAAHMLSMIMSDSVNNQIVKLHLKFKALKRNDKRYNKIIPITLFLNVYDI